MTQAPLDHFGIIAPASAYVGQPFEISLTALDAFGNTVAGYQGTALLTPSGSGTLEPAQAVFSAGEATLEVTYSEAEEITITATDSENPAITGESAGISVVTPPLDHFGVISPASAYVGQPFEINLTALDAFGNTVAGYQGTALLTTSGTGTLEPAQAVFSAGEATLEVTYSEAEEITITATDSENPAITGQSGTIAVEPSITELAVISMAPCVAMRGALLNGAEISGAGFSGSMEARLEKGEDAITATDVVVVSDTLITCDFALSGIETGMWDIVVEIPGSQTARHSGGLRIAAGKGPLRAWGINDYGQGDVPAGSEYIAITTGGNHSMALLSDGSLAAWGLNGDAQATAPSGNGYVDIAAGGYHSLALRSDGSILAWGRNDHGQADAPTGSDFIAVSAGWNYSLALRADGTIVAWGDNSWGQLGVPSGGDFQAVSAGGYHAAALRSDGSVEQWGNNSFGQLDNPPQGDDFVAVSAGGFHSLALHSDGTVYGWGNNAHGQAEAPAGSDFVAVSTGGYHSLALRSDGSILAWGDNVQGQTDVPPGLFSATCGGGTCSLAIARQGVNYFLVTAPESAMMGQPFPITILACDIHGEVVPEYEGTALLTTSGTGTIEPAQAVFSAGEATLEVTYSEAEVITITATDSGDPTITGQSSEVAIDSLEPEQISINPETLMIGWGETYQFACTDGSGNPIPPQSLSWTVGGGIGEIDGDGVFTATSTGIGSVTASYGDPYAIAEVSVVTLIDEDNLTEDTTWTAAMNPIVIDHILTVNPGVTLEIEPGVVVKFVGEESGIAVLGGMIAEGEADTYNHISFTSIFDDSLLGDTALDGETWGTPGDWLTLGYRNSDNTGTAYMKYCDVLYSGGLLNSAILSIPVEEGTDGARSFDHCTVRYSASAGVELLGGNDNFVNGEVSNNAFAGIVYGPSAQISDCVIDNNSGDGMYGSSFEPGEILAPTITGNTVRNNGGRAVYAGSYTVADDITGNRGYGNEVNGIVFSGLSLDNSWSPTNMQFAGEELPYVFEGLVDLGPTLLTLQPGTVVKFMPEASLTASALNVVGLETQRVIFTSANDSSVGGETITGTSPAPGDWGHIRLFDSTASISECSMRYGGGEEIAEFIVDGGSPSLNNFSISDSQTAGMFIYNSAATFSGGLIENNATGVILDNDGTVNTTVSGCEIRGNHGNGIKVMSSCSNLAISGNAISANDGRGIYLEDPVEQDPISQVTICNNTLENNGSEALFLGVNSANSVTGNCGHGNGINGICITDIRVDTTWDGSNVALTGEELAYVVSDDIIHLTLHGEIPPDANMSKLSLEPGAVVKVAEGKSVSIARLDINNGLVVGPGDEAYITSIHDDQVGGDTDAMVLTPAPGDWGSFIINTGAQSFNASYGVIRYGGGSTNYPSMLGISAGNAYMENCTIADSTSPNAGAFMIISGEAIINGSTFSNHCYNPAQNSTAGLLVMSVDQETEALTGGLSISDCQLLSNGIGLIGSLSEISIASCQFSENSLMGASLTTSVTANVYDCAIFNNGIGLAAVGSGMVQVDTCLLNGNINSGIMLSGDAGEPLGSELNASVTGSTIESGFIGLSADSIKILNVSNNQFKDNLIMEVMSPGDGELTPVYFGVGMIVTNSSGTVQGNTLLNQPVEPANPYVMTSGIQALDCAEITISDNSLTGHMLAVNAEATAECPDATAHINSNTVEDCSFVGVSTSGGKVEVVDNTAFSCGYAPYLLHRSTVLSMPTNQGSGTYWNGRLLIDCTLLVQTITNDNPELPLLIYGTCHVPNPLAIEPGTTLKFLPTMESSNPMLSGESVEAGMLDIGGAIIAPGASPEERITFTSVRDDSVGGDSNPGEGEVAPAILDWRGVVAVEGNEAESRVTYCDFRYADMPLKISGNPDPASNGELRALAFVDGCRFENSGNGLWLDYCYLNDIGINEETVAPEHMQGVKYRGTRFSNCHIRSERLHTQPGGIPYIFAGLIMVPEGCSLTIDSDVIVKFDIDKVDDGDSNTYDLPAGKLKVDGYLLAPGNPENGIVFTSLKDDSVWGDSNPGYVPAPGESSEPAADDWHGIELDKTQEKIISHCRIAYAHHGIEFLGSTGIVTTCEIRHCWNGIAIDAENITGCIEVIDNKVWGCREGDGNGIWIRKNGNIVLARNECYDNGCGMRISEGSYQIRNNDIHNNYTGIYANKLGLGASIIRNRVYSNEYVGIDLINSDCIVSHNEIGLVDVAPPPGIGGECYGLYIHQSEGNHVPIVTKNLIQYNRQGLYIGCDSQPVVYANKIRNNTNAGVIADNPTKALDLCVMFLVNGEEKFRGNDITDNDDYAVFNRNVNAPIYIAHNYLNTLKPETTGANRISSGVEYEYYDMDGKKHTLAPGSQWEEMLQEERDLGYDNYCGFHDTVNTSTGNLVKTYTDMDIPSLIVPLKLNRTYNSLAHENDESAFGFGWSFTFGAKLKVNRFIEGDPNSEIMCVSVTWEDGRTDVYDRLTDGTFLSPLGVTDELTKEGELWTVVKQDKTRYRFDTEGRLKLVYTPNSVVSENPAENNTCVVFEYSGLVVTKVIAPSTESAARRELEITWTSFANPKKPGDTMSVVTRITDNRGMETTYEYEESAGVLKRVNYGTNHDNCILYGYDNHGRLNSISQLVNSGDAVSVEEYTYKDEESGKLKEVMAGGQKRTDYTYDTDHQFTLVNEYLDSGSTCKTMKHYYDSSGRITREMSCYDVAADIWYTTSYEYNQDSQCARIIDPRDAETLMEHHDSLIMRKTEPSGAITAYSYYPDSDPARRKLLRDETYSPDGSEWFVNRYFYDERGNLEETEYAIPANAYDPSLYAKGSNAGMKEVTYVCNAMGQPTTITEYAKDNGAYQVSKVTLKSYNAHGDITCEEIKDSTGGPTRSRVDYEYDLQGRLIHEKKWQYEANAQERYLSYGDDGISRFKPVAEYVSHSKDGATTLYERRTTAFYLDGQVRKETSAELGYFNAEDFIVTDAEKKVQAEYSYYTTGHQTSRLLEKTTTGPKTADGSGQLTAGELERRRYTWHRNGLPANESLVVGGEEKNTLTYAYDSLFREAYRTEKVTYAKADGSLETRQVMTTYAYDPSGNMTLERPPGSGKGTEKEYDLAGRVTRETDPTGAVKRYTYDRAGNKTAEIVEKTGGGTIETAYAYDALSREISVTRPNPDDPEHPIVTTYAYGANAKTAVTSVPARPELGAKTIDYAYDALGRLLTEARHYEGGTAVTTHAYDLCGNETYLAEPGQPALTKAYDLAGRLEKTTAGAVLAPEGPTVNLTLEEYTYDPAGKKATSRAPYGSGKDWEGTTTTYLYDGLGRELRVVQELPVEDAVTVHAWTYQVVGEGAAILHTVTLPEGLTAETTADQRGREIRKEYPAYPGRTTWTEITEYGASDAANLKTEKAHGPAPDNLTTTTYDAAGRATRTTDAAGGETTKEYNERGLAVRETTKVDSDATAETIHTYDDLSRETMTCRGYEGANPTEPRYFAYDIFGRKLSEWDSVSEAYPATFTYNLLDHLTREARPIDGSTSFTKLYGRDEAGRMTSLSVQDAAAPGGAALVRDITYSHLGVPLRVVSHPTANPSDNITNAYAWDAGGRMTTETDGAGGVWNYAYNPQGLPAHSTDPLSNTTTIYYDLEGRATRSETADAGENLASFTEMTYAPTGEIVSRTYSYGSAGSATETYAYDECGRLLGATSPGEVTLTYAGYDPANRPTTLTYEVGEKTYTETLSYTQGGAISSVLLPSGEISYGYNEQGRLAHVESPGGTFYNYYYDSRGLPASLTLPGDAGEITYAYTLDGRSAGVSLTPEGESVPSASLSLTYDAYGRVDGMERQMETTDPASGTYVYAYDRLGRLASAQGPAAIPTYAYTYDNRGPVATKTVDPPGEEDPTTTTYAYDAAGRLDSDSAGNDYAYDAAGRMTSATGPRGLTSLAWDGAGRMVAATSAGGSETTQAAYAYDHTGRMLSREESAGSTTSASIFLPFALTQETAAIYDPAGGGDEGTLTYSFASGFSGIRLAQTDHTQDPAETTYPFRSRRGDVLALISEDGSLAQTYAYEPYGEMEGDYSAEGTPFLYQDDYRDPASGLYHMQARWYDPQAALFTSQDPAMGDATDPTLRYPYAYCAGDPVYNADPSGERLVEGNDPSTELHYTMASLQASARRRGIPVSRAAREKSAYLQKIIQKRALWKAMASLRANLRPEDMSASTLERLQSQGIDPTALKQHLFPRIQDALGAGSYAEVTSIIIEMGESGSFTEQDVRYFISRTAMNQRMQEEYVNVFHQAERGLYEKGSTWGELFKGETWKKAAPGIKLGVAIAFSVAAAVGTCGGALIASGTISATAGTLSLGSVSISAGGVSQVFAWTSAGIGVSDPLKNQFDATLAYARGEITAEQLSELSLLNTVRAGTNIGATQLSPIGSIASPVSMEVVNTGELLEEMKMKNSRLQH